MVNRPGKKRLLLLLLLLFGPVGFASPNCEDNIFNEVVAALNKTLNFVLLYNTFLNVDGLLGLNTAQVVFCHVTLTFQNDEAELLTRTVDKLDRTFEFILKDSVTMNVDGILGVNVARAHLHKALSKAKNISTVLKLATLIDKARSIDELQTPQLPNFPYKYYVFNNYVIPSKLWERDVNFSYGKLNPNPKVYTGPYNVDNVMDYKNYIRNTNFSEEASDACFVEVATASDDTEPHDCPVSDRCVEEMLTIPTRYSPDFPGYGVTHKAIYLQIARNRNCNFDYGKVNELLEEECSYILWELRKNVQHGYIALFDDLFFEQIDICGFEGFGEFLQRDYLEHVLNAQNPHGGFGLMANSNRPKRESVRMKHGANSHTTGLAVSVLALYIRVLVEKPFSNKPFYEDKF